MNPAYAGSRDALTLTGLHRTQWASFPGAPITQTLTVHAPILKNKLGLGFSLLNDKIGTINNQGIFVDIAYRLELRKGYLSIGLKGGLSLYSNRITDLYKLDDNDPEFASNIETRLLPNAGFGVYYHSKKFFLGVSSPRLIQNSFSELETASELRHAYLIAGGRFNLSSNNKLELRPSAYFKMTRGAQAQLDLTALFYYNNKFWVGPMFRSTDALGLLAGINITDQFQLGYSFDWSYGNQTFKYNGGSHEIMLRYDFIFKDDGKITSPRYF